MISPQDQLVLQLASESPTQTLLCLGESTIPASSLRGFAGVILSNRWDVAQAVKAVGVAVKFSDFDISTALGDFVTATRIVMGVAKEKAINKHIIDQFLSIPSLDELVFVGEKKQGINSIVSHVPSDVYTLERTKHKKQLQDVVIRKTSTPFKSDSDNEYSGLGKIDVAGFEFWSKPGLYGWNKVDKGSELLVQCVLEWIEGRSSKPDGMLDLGCGYGYLSMRIGDKVDRVVATDNNAAALSAVDRNLNALRLGNYCVTPSDCADSIKEKFGLIVCNPPFHKGFSHEKSLTEQFVITAKNRLNEDGVAFFVVNEFIGIEKFINKYFTKQQMLVKKDGFKVMLAHHA
ncbi:Ribosomal RNA small subunit methyltransferase C [BD1-7 clade bacterium]|uniref:Ribosomal RNA small subunit methyltransferase C n=1 Tax=BD1-7 clade bacterium TaxID=2029982 RepID=A0A5S9QR09_9GAMM|nr:Ribosomal RNA small subunit methyltransferase C [BD1-7 clade bacterium]CAA0120848.1 Ribosomal RNA small subunit methyltransferase C [BD1-7 clade bacterium]